MQNKHLKITVLGIGGGAQNIVDYLYLNNKFKNITFMLINADERVLEQAKTPDKYILSGKYFSDDGKSLGCGGDSEIGEEYAYKHLDKLQEITKDSDLVFLISTFGAGCGTGATPVIAKILKETNIKTIAIITKPFRWEGKKRTKQAQNGLEKLRQYVEKIIIIDNQALTKNFPPYTSLSKSFEYVNEKIAEEFYKNLFNSISY